MKTRWSRLVELRKRAVDEAQQALGRASAELSRAREALAAARAIEEHVAEDRDRALARGVVEREWSELEAWLARKRSETHGAAASVMEREAAMERARAVVQARSLDLFRLEALETRERDARRRAETRTERIAEDEHASVKHSRASTR